MPTAQEMKTKFFLKSMTVWGGILAVLPAIWATLGIDPIFTAEEIGEPVKQFLLVAQEVVGLILVIWGRFRAGEATPHSVTVVPFKASSRRDPR
jgi:hypothetical protein